MDDADRLNSPLLPPRGLPGAPDEPFRFQGIPGIEVTRGGNRFAVWYGGGDGEGPQNFLMLARRNSKKSCWPSSSGHMGPSAAATFCQCRRCAPTTSAS